MTASFLCAALLGASVAAVGFGCVGWGPSWRRVGGGLGKGPL
ncbi:hypothetical protein [Streptomyces sp. NPDC052114]